MNVVSDLEVCRSISREQRHHRRSVGFVPTMGALHTGHAALLADARRRSDFVVVSIFVNPTQFAPGEDYARYPRTLEHDLMVCESQRVDLVFTPDVSAVYPEASKTRVVVDTLGDVLCSPFRPGHFDGVATVVAKLFAIVEPCMAIFGEKDFQQLAIVRRMVRDLHFPIAVIGHPTVREPDGLAMSSRNVYLSPSERIQSGVISEALFEAVRAVQDGQFLAAAIIESVRRRILSRGPAAVEYVDVVDSESLARLVRVDRAARICAAVRIGTTRLIDNVAVGPAGA